MDSFSSEVKFQMSDLTPQINILKTNTNNNSPFSPTRGEGGNKISKKRTTMQVRSKNSMYICDLCMNSEESLSSTGPIIVGRCPHRKINLDEFFVESKEKQKEAIEKKKAKAKNVFRERMST